MRGSDTALVEFRFASRLADDLPEAALWRLARLTQQFNRMHGLTGEMRRERHNLRQVIEGSWSVVMPLAARILTDRRHGAISITSFRPIRARRFHDWSSKGFGEGVLPARLAHVGDGELRVLPLPACVEAGSAARDLRAGST